jgi:uncharacterized protein (TIGR02246 family)
LKDETTILALEEAYDLAWNRGDAKALVSSFTPDAIIVNPRGEVAVGRAEFEKAMTGLLNGSFKGSIHKTKIIRIHFPKEDFAVVDGEATLTGIKEIEGSTALTHRFTDVVVRENDRWLITDVRAYVFLPRPTRVT